MSAINASMAWCPASTIRTSMAVTTLGSLLRRISRAFYRTWFAVFFIPLMVNTTAAIDGYPNGFPDDPTFFPIGVWLQSPEHAPAYKAIGINTFVGLWEGPTESQLATLAINGMFVVSSQNNVALHSVNRGIIKGWLH